MSQDNKTLGTFKLDGIAPAPRGTPQIEVTFDIDANGILNVTAKDQGTGKDQKITISGSSSMDEAEVERLQQGSGKICGTTKKRKIRYKSGTILIPWFINVKSNLRFGDKAPDDLEGKD